MIRREPLAEIKINRSPDFIHGPVHQALSNLLENAVKYGDLRATIDISAMWLKSRSDGNFDSVLA